MRLAGVRVLGASGAAAAKWVLTPADERSRLPAGADEASPRTARLANGTMLAAERAVHSLGDDAAGLVAGWGLALRSMRRGGAAVHFAAPDAAGADGGRRHVEIELLDVTRVEDLSPRKGLPVPATVLGVGAETPADGARVTVELHTADAAPDAVLDAPDAA